MEKKIILLSRVSTSPQDIESQTNDLIREATKLGYNATNQIIIENVESGIKLSEEERLGLNKMKHYIETDQSIDCVMCWEPSRLARQQKILFSIRDYLLSKKIQLYILKPYVKLLDDSREKIDPTANIVFSLYATMSENEIMLKKDRFIREKSKMKQAGQKFAGAVVFGYMKDKDKHCVKHPLHSKIISEIFNHYVETEDSSLYETYEYISDMYPEVFTVLPYIKAQHKIRNILVNEIYYKGNWCYQAIVTEDIAKRAKLKMENARCKPRYKCKKDLLCRGKIYCGHCGKMMTPSGGNTKAYICPTDKQHRLQVNFDIADWLIWEETKHVVNTNAVFDNESKQNEIRESIKMKENEIMNLKNTLDKAREKSEKLLDLYMEEKINKDVFDRRNKDINDEIKLYTSKINNIQTQRDELRIVIEDTQRDILNLKSVDVSSIENFESRLEYVRKYIRKITATKTDDGILLEFTYRGGVIVAQRGVYLYTYKGGRKKLYRINEDNSIDLIKK